MQRHVGGAASGIVWHCESGGSVHAGWAGAGCSLLGWTVRAAVSGLVRELRLRPFATPLGSACTSTVVEGGAASSSGQGSRK
jgi:hypothetical protein